MWTDHFWLVVVLWKDACSFFFFLFLPETNSGEASPGKTAIFLAQHNPLREVVISHVLLTLGFKVRALFITSQDDIVWDGGRADSKKKKKSL